MVRPGLLASSILALAPLAASAQTAAPPPGYPAPGEPTVITLISTGAEPRHPLRYAVPAGYRGHMNMDMTMSITMAARGEMRPPVSVPTVRVGVDLAVASVTAGGEMTITLAFTGMNFLDQAGMDSAARAPFDAMSTEFRKIRGTATMTNRGFTRDLQIDASRVADPQLSQLMSSIKNSLAGLSMPLPEEAVGTGAQWEVRQAMDSSGVTIFQKVRCELAALDVASATLNVTTEQTAPAQPMHNPTLPASAAVSIESVSGAGSGTMKLAFGALVPTSEMASKNTMVMALKAGNAAPQKMTVETSLKLVVEPTGR